MYGVDAILLRVNAGAICCLFTVSFALSCLFCPANAVYL